jgi:hypothetical protein
MYACYLVQSEVREFADILKHFSVEISTTFAIIHE